MAAAFGKNLSIPTQLPEANGPAGLSTLREAGRRGGARGRRSIVEPAPEPVERLAPDPTEVRRLEIVGLGKPATAPTVHPWGASSAYSRSISSTVTDVPPATRRGVTRSPTSKAMRNVLAFTRLWGALRPKRPIGTRNNSPSTEVGEHHHVSLFPLGGEQASRRACAPARAAETPSLLASPWLTRQRRPAPTSRCTDAGCTPRAAAR